MVSKRDIWIVANQCLQQHGEDAELTAAQRADELMPKGDIDGSRVWRQVLDRIKQLKNTSPTGDLH